MMAHLNSPHDTKTQAHRASRRSESRQKHTVNLLHSIVNLHAGALQAANFAGFNGRLYIRQDTDKRVFFVLPPTQPSVHSGCETPQNAALEDSSTSDRQHFPTRASAIVPTDRTTESKTKGELDWKCYTFLKLRSKPWTVNHVSKVFVSKCSF